MMSIARRIWSEDTPFDYEGEFFRYEAAFSSVKPVTPGGIPLYFAGASPPAIEVGAAASRRLRLLGRTARRGRRANGDDQ